MSSWETKITTKQVVFISSLFFVLWFCLGVILKISEPLAKSKPAERTTQTQQETTTTRSKIEEVKTADEPKVVAKPDPVKQIAKKNHSPAIIWGIGKKYQASSSQLLAAQLDVPLVEHSSTNETASDIDLSALSMLFAYYGYSIERSTLKEKRQELPSQATDFHSLAALAKLLVKDEVKVIESRGRQLTDLLVEVGAKRPVLVLMNSDFNQSSSQIHEKNQIGPLHSVIITGFNPDTIYFNDPLIGKNQEIDRHQFEKIFNEMGKQALYFYKKLEP